MNGINNFLVKQANHAERTMNRCFTNVNTNVLQHIPGNSDPGLLPAAKVLFSTLRGSLNYIQYGLANKLAGKEVKSLVKAIADTFPIK